MTQRRQRLRASDIAKQRKPSWFNLILLGVALILVIVFKANMGDSAADFFSSLTKDPSTELPTATPDGPRGIAPAPAPEGASAQAEAP